MKKKNGTFHSQSQQQKRDDEMKNRTSVSLNGKKKMKLLFMCEGRGQKTLRAASLPFLFYRSAEEEEKEKKDGTLYCETHAVYCIDIHSTTPDSLCSRNRQGSIKRKKEKRNQTTSRKKKKKVLS